MRFVIASFFVAVLLVVSPVRAQEDDAPAAPAPAPTELHVNGDLGVSMGPGNGPTLGATMLVRHHLFAAGASGTLVGSLGSTSYGLAAIGALVGLATEAPSPGWRLAALAEIGVDHYSGYDAEFLGSDPGASATLPYAGLRLMVLHRWRHFEIGPAFTMAGDLGSAHVTYSYSDHGGILGGDPPYPTVAATHDVGTARMGVVFVMGGAIDL